MTDIPKPSLPIHEEVERRKKVTQLLNGTYNSITEEVPDEAQEPDLNLVHYQEPDFTSFNTAYEPPRQIHGPNPLSEFDKHTEKVMLENESFELELNSVMVSVEEATISIGFDPTHIAFKPKVQSCFKLTVRGKTYPVISAGGFVSFKGLQYKILIFFIDAS